MTRETCPKRLKSTSRGVKTMQFFTFTSWKRVADGDLPEQAVPCLIIRDGQYHLAQQYLGQGDAPLWVIKASYYRCRPTDIWMKLPMEKDVCALFD